MTCLNVVYEGSVKFFLSPVKLHFTGLWQSSVPRAIFRTVCYHSAIITGVMVRSEEKKKYLNRLSGFSFQSQGVASEWRNWKSWCDPLGTGSMSDLGLDSCLLLNLEGCQIFWQSSLLYSYISICADPSISCTFPYPRWIRCGSQVLLQATVGTSWGFQGK